ncbi:hypothetical protein M422DRAFT_254959 [Sphaerobolus stellatus SS14]|uniref:RNA-dependent RNA polymerase n=1 Tax=Sphaerobolus stellatus (strain SS14) TaxID=990650 RepID=A0A0C9VK07_SPHS4|nr:hypothetical protein M422DRAFT_254959 [Sphaerobolus stellatus SS14]
MGLPLIGCAQTRCSPHLSLLPPPTSNVQQRPGTQSIAEASRNVLNTNDGVNGIFGEIMDDEDDVLDEHEILATPFIISSSSSFSNAFRQSDSMVTIATSFGAPYQEYWSPHLDDCPPEFFEVARQAEAKAASELFKYSAEEAPVNPFLDSVTTPKRPECDAPTISTESIVTIAQPYQYTLEQIRKLLYGVQWEITRLVEKSPSGYHKFLPYIEGLVASNSQSTPRVLKIWTKLSDSETDTESGRTTKSDSRAERNIKQTAWSELDQEEELSREKTGKIAGLGFSNVSGWYGDKVHFIARLKDLEKDKSNKGKLRHSHGSPSYQIILQRSELGPSNRRFSRRFGSRRFIHVRVAKSIMMSGNSSLVEYFQKPFLLNGRIFKAFCLKDTSITRDHRSALSFLDFIEYHNPMDLNNQQHTYAGNGEMGARFAFGLSSSVPVSSDWTGEGKVLAEMVCIHCTVSLTHRLINSSGPLPMAVVLSIWQECANCKPVLVGKDCHLLSRSTIKYDPHSVWDEFQFIIDVLRPSRLKTPSRLSTETIVCIAHNQDLLALNGKSKHSSLCRLMQEGLNQVMEVFGKLASSSEEEKAGDSPLLRHAMVLLWNEVCKTGDVNARRMGREFSESTDARGLVNKFYGDDDDKDEESGAVEEDDLLDDEFMSTRTPEETIMRLLDAGLTPSSPYVHEKLKLVIRKVAERFVQQFRIEVPGSVGIFCVPDLLGILEENEVFLECSKPVFPGPDGVEVEVLVGDILVGRLQTFADSVGKRPSQTTTSTTGEILQQRPTTLQGDRQKIKMSDIATKRKAEDFEAEPGVQKTQKRAKQDEPEAVEEVDEAEDAPEENGGNETDDEDDEDDMEKELLALKNDAEGEVVGRRTRGVRVDYTKLDEELGHDEDDDEDDDDDEDAEERDDGEDADEANGVETADASKILKEMKADEASEDEQDKEKGGYEEDED